MLEISKIHTFYGDSHILFGVSLDVKKQEVVALLGRNGVGKTTTLRSIMGLTPPKEGKITLTGNDITNEKIFKRAKIGIGYVPEDRGLFPGLTVHENLILAADGADTAGDYENALRFFPELKRYLNNRAGRLSGGEQQMLAVGRALIGKKHLLILDEPLQGLAPKIVERLTQAIEEIKKETAVLMVEQNTNLALDIADRVYIMRDGRIVFSGMPNEVRENKDIQAYLVVA
ncbi:MAG: ABC transporter ATP-binding protein [Candidatus Bathyarchaeota archaeon]|nr:ABC transporter ATP-binding protein [Candidatus Bathyarchaeota archaeon]